jgi:type I restriction enzyme S subunit
MYGTIGKVIINKVPVAISQNIAAIILNREKVNEEYLHYALQTYSYQFKRQAKPITLRHLDIKIVKKILLPLPPVPEQQKIAEILSTVDKKLEIERNEKARLEKIKQGLMDLLLTGKVRVKVD